MNYKKIYDVLIERARTRVLDCYKEKHHIIPRCMDGTNDKSNLVDLTPEEHYVAHQLLTKIYPDNYALAKAAHMMVCNRPSNKYYGWLRKRFSKAKSVEQRGSGNSQYGTKWVHNPLTKEAKKIKGDQPNGWCLGRNSKKIKQKKNRIYVDPQKLQSDINLYREYYKLYSTVGFDEFVRQTNYTYSKANLVQRLGKLLPEFVPQNGKKR